MAVLLLDSVRRLESRDRKRAKEEIVKTESEGDDRRLEILRLFHLCLPCACACAVREKTREVVEEGETGGSRGSTFLIQGEAIKMTEPLLARADLYPFTTQRVADKK